MERRIGQATRSPTSRCATYQEVSLTVPISKLVQNYLLYFFYRPRRFHAPAWGGRLLERPQGAGLRCFNPRPRVGGDEAMDPEILLQLVSIHAPAWGATTVKDVSGQLISFQSTPPRGGRPSYRSALSKTRGFNPRPPRGGRRTPSPPWPPLSRFNPRPPRGGRRVPNERNTNTSKFQSTPPAWGATL
jgi:hypothetical protein